MPLTITINGHLVESIREVLNEIGLVVIDNTKAAPIVVHIHGHLGDVDWKQTATYAACTLEVTQDEISLWQVSKKNGFRPSL